MPRKRPLDVRITEMEEKMAKLKMEKAIMEMRARFPRRRRRPARQRSFGFGG